MVVSSTCAEILAFSAAFGGSAAAGAGLEMISGPRTALCSESYSPAAYVRNMAAEAFVPYVDVATSSLRSSNEV